MKSIAFFLTTAVATLAMAYPSVKDMASFKGKYSSAAGGDIDYNQTLEVINFDAASKVYTLKSTVNYNGQTNVQNQEISADELLTNEKVANILANCSEMGGAPDSLTTAAGTFNTCKVPQERGGQIWVGDLPFGFAKEIFIDEEGNRTEVEVVSFAHGQ